MTAINFMQLKCTRKYANIYDTSTLRPNLYTWQCQKLELMQYRNLGSKPVYIVLDFYKSKDWNNIH